MGTSNLVAWYWAGAVGGTASNIVTDLSGGGNSGQVLSSTGLSVGSDAPGSLNVSPTCPAAVPYVSGSTATKLSFATLTAGADFSTCVVSRYQVTGTKTRVLTTVMTGSAPDSSNYILGHWSGYAGVVFDGGTGRFVTSITPNQAFTPDTQLLPSATDWLVQVRDER